MTLDECALTRDRPSSENTVTCFQFDEDKNAVEVTATTCDGNPECYLGEDECLEECDHDVKKPGGFCDLWSNGTGYECLPTSTASVIIPCDGVIDCVNKKDEKYCYKKSGKENKLEESHFSTTSKLGCLYNETSFPNDFTTPCKVPRNSLWNGRNDCESEKDECPLWFSSNSTRKLLHKSVGVSDEENLISSNGLKIFIFAAGAFGMVMNVVSLLVSITTWIKTFQRTYFDENFSVDFSLKLLYE